MKRKIIVTIALMLILGTTLLLVNAKSDNQIPYTHSYTKAVCDINNFCQDYEVICKNDKMIKISPITGAVVQFNSNWQDSRDSESINISC